MIRFLNIIALIAVIGSATWAYSVKYETILIAEKLRKRETELQRERGAIAILKAEWHLLNRPERLQQLAKPEQGMQQLTARQVVSAADVPTVTPGETDRIEDLLTGSIPTPDSAHKTAKAAKGTTPSATANALPPKPKTITATKTVTATKTTTGTKAAASKTTATVKSSAALKAAPPTPARAGAPIRLTPPAPVGASPEPATRSASREDNPLTGFLKKLIR
jgi:hypothetical protein